MPQNVPSKGAPATPLPRRNLLLLAVALVTIVAGYLVLGSDANGGSAEAASVLLVVGYCVLFPLALIA